MGYRRLYAAWLPARFAGDGTLALDDRCRCPCGGPMVASTIAPGTLVLSHAVTCGTYLAHGHGSLTSYRGTDVALAGTIWCATPALTSGGFLDPPSDSPWCLAGVVMEVEAVCVRCSRCAGVHAREGTFYLVPAAEIAETESAEAPDEVYTLCQPCARFFPRAWRASLTTVTLRSGAVAHIDAPGERAP